MLFRTQVWSPLCFLGGKRLSIPWDYLLPMDRVHQQSHHCVSSIVASIVATSDNVMASVPRMHTKPIDQPTEFTPSDLGPLFVGSDRKHKGIEDRSWFREEDIRAEKVQF